MIKIIKSLKRGCLTCDSRLGKVGEETVLHLTLRDSKRELQRIPQIRSSLSTHSGKTGIPPRLGVHLGHVDRFGPVDVELSFAEKRLRTKNTKVFWKAVGKDFAVRYISVIKLKCHSFFHSIQLESILPLRHEDKFVIRQK